MPGVGSASQRAQCREPHGWFGMWTAFCCLSAGKVTRTLWCCMVISQGNKSPVLPTVVPAGTTSPLPWVPASHGVFVLFPTLRAHQRWKRSRVWGFFSFSLSFRSVDICLLYRSPRQKQASSSPPQVAFADRWRCIFLRGGCRGPLRGMRGKYRGITCAGILHSPPCRRPAALPPALCFCARETPARSKPAAPRSALNRARGYQPG